MNETVVAICCEGPICNAGESAKDREAALASRSPTQAIRSEAAHGARGYVSRQLDVTPHVRVGPGAWGAVMFRCLICEHERQYGNTF